MRRTKEDTDKTIEQIFNSALAVFNSRGYHAATVEGIAEHGQMSKGPIFWHFKNKANLYKVVLERTAQEFNEGLENAFHEKYSAKEKIDNCVSFLFTNSIKRHNQIGIFFRFVKNVDDQEEFEETRILVENSLGAVIRNLRDTITYGIDIQVFNSPSSVDFLTYSLNSYLWGLLLNPTVNYEDYSNVELKNNVMHVIYEMLDYKQ